MALSSRSTRATIITVALGGLVLAGCGSDKKDNTKSSGPGAGSGSTSKSASDTPAATSKDINIGTTDQVIALDPAGSYDFGSTMLETNIYQYLLAVPAGKTAPEGDAAQSCSFTKPTEFTCILKDGLKFSNGDPLTSADVAFSFNRVNKINDPNGPASLIPNMASVAAPDAKTVVFTLKNANDQTWPFVLGTSAGPIVDSKVFAADKELADDKVIGSGPYMIKSYQKNQIVQLVANPNYTGANKAQAKSITLKYYTKSNNMKLDVQSGQIDVAYRSFSAQEIEDLGKDSNVKVLTGAGGELRYVVFNYKTMPGSNDAQKRAIRRAMAYSVDRQDLATNVYNGTYTPLYSMVPQGIAGATEPFKDTFGEKPDKAKAQAELTAAGVKTPVDLTIDYTTDHYGPLSADEYNELKRQLEGTGLFKLKINGTAWTTYNTERKNDTYPVLQLGWFPDFVDADNFIGPFLTEDNFVHAHYCDKGAKNRPCDSDKVLPLITAEETSTGAARTDALTTIQKTLAEGSLPLLPLLQGKQLAVTHGEIAGAQATLDPTYLFRMWMLSKS